jgi:hypothetical protein
LGVDLLTVSFGGGWADTPTAENTNIMPPLADVGLRSSTPSFFKLWPIFVRSLHQRQQSKSTV